MAALLIRHRPCTVVSQTMELRAWWSPGRAVLEWWDLGAYAVDLVGVGAVDLVWAGTVDLGKQRSCEVQGAKQGRHTMEGARQDRRAAELCRERG